MTKLLPLHEYYAALMGCDFDFEGSDDPGWYRREKAKIDGLEAQARASEQHRALFDQFAVHHSARVARIWNRSVIVPPLPERPAVEAAANG